jgi:hypothetical protein
MKSIIPKGYKLYNSSSERIKELYEDTTINGLPPRLMNFYQDFCYSFGYSDKNGHASFCSYLQIEESLICTCVSSHNKYTYAKWRLEKYGY